MGFCRTPSVKTVTSVYKYAMCGVSFCDKMKTFFRKFIFMGTIAISTHSASAFQPESLPAAGFHPDGINYYSSAMFANALHQSGEWLAFTNFDWGNYIEYWNQPQFNSNGYPRFLSGGISLRAIPYGINNPENVDIVTGKFTLEWTGAADIRYGGTFLTAESSGAATGVLTNGRRVYRASTPQSLTILQINSNNPPTNIRLWMPDPADPQNRSLTNQLWHPSFLARLRDRNWGVIRMMNMQSMNANPQMDWSDRRPPDHIFMCGVLNPRSPGAGSDGYRDSGIAFEQMVNLCNISSNDLWVCVPHLATPQFVTNLARLIRFGSDGNLPYTSAVTNPVYAPLSTNLRVFVEYSNEIWNGGYSFPQGDWADDEAVLVGINRARFNARKFCDTWRIFQQVFGGTSRLVRVAATFTAVQSYSADFLNEIKSYGPTRSPPVEPDIIGITTYFGNGIQDWAHEKAQIQAGTSDPWFYTTNTFGSPARPVSLPITNAYWTSANLERHINETFNEWKRRLLAGDAAEGGGPDAVGLGGGFDRWMTELARTNFAAPKPLVAYEGGPSIYTDYLNGADPQDDGITDFMNALNRRAPMAEVYRMHLEVARSKGLWMHMPFVVASQWSKYGQWGHLEYTSQHPTNSPKYRFILDWANETSVVRHVDRAIGTAPAFNQSAQLPVIIARAPYDQMITTSGGEGARKVELIGSLLSRGLRLEFPTNQSGQIRISGAPTEPGFSYLMLRVTDGDGDPAWQTFTLPVGGGFGTLLESTFAGTNLASRLPWTNTLVKAPRISFSGWTNGAGAIASTGENGIFFFVDAPSTEAPLSSALSDQEFLGFNLVLPTNYVLNLAGATCRFGVRRQSWHAPRRYAIMTSVDGFSTNAVLFTSDYYAGDTSDITETFTFPTTAAYRAISGTLQVRMYGFAGQFSGHRSGLIDFKITAAMPYPVIPAGADTDGDGLADAWETQFFGNLSSGATQDSDGDGMSNLAEYLSGTNPTSNTSLLSTRTAAAPGVDAVRIEWPSVSNAFYAIDATDDLLDPEGWYAMASGIAATPPLNVHTSVVPRNARMYRIMLESVP